MWHIDTIATLAAFDLLTLTLNQTLALTQSLTLTQTQPQPPLLANLNLLNNVITISTPMLRYRTVLQEAFMLCLAVVGFAGMSISPVGAASTSGSTGSASGSLEIRTTSGTFRGFSSTSSLSPSPLDTWLGIPFARPPVGALRFKAPVALGPGSDAVKNATAFGPLCPQATSQLSSVAEDCLYLNVWRPAGTSADAKLPVLVWFHGGGYMTGDARSDPSGMIARSVAIGKPIMFVSTSYRLNTFGFLASASVPPEDLNAGLLDQRAALAFIQDNIASFGGDPTKVTIWGQSAGAGAMQSHFLYPAQRRLFRAGISDSSTGPYKSSPVVSVYDEPGKPFARLLASTNCTAGRGAVDCLRKVPFQTLLTIANSMADATFNGQLWEPSVGPAGSMITQEASERMRSGNFLRLPYLAGTNLNEGNGFSTSLRNQNLRGTAQTARFQTFIRQLQIDDSKLTSDVLDRFSELYPEGDTSLGGAFDTGDSLFDRGAAWYTDVMYLAPRRLFVQNFVGGPGANAGSDQSDVWVYSFREFTPGNDRTLGVSHGSELAYLFGPLPSAAVATETALSNQMRDFYINFVNTLNPGAPWKPYRADSKQVLQIIRNNVTMIDDTFLSEKTNFINTDRVLAQLQK